MKTLQREKDFKALEIAKQIPRNIIRIPQGMSGEHLRPREMPNSQRTRHGVDKAEVYRLYDEGKTQVEIAKIFRVTNRTISYHIRNRK